MKFVGFTIFNFFFLIQVTTAKTNFVLVMADDQGWGQTGYYNHPILETPNLDAMASNGLRFDRFYVWPGLFSYSGNSFNGANT